MLIWSRCVAFSDKQKMVKRPYARCQNKNLNFTHFQKAAQKRGDQQTRIPLCETGISGRCNTTCAKQQNAVASTITHLQGTKKFMYKHLVVVFLLFFFFYLLFFVLFFFFCFSLIFLTVFFSIFLQHQTTIFAVDASPTPNAKNMRQYAASLHKQQQQQQQRLVYKNHIQNC